VPIAETKLKAFDFAKEWTTQLFTVASAVVVFSATFYKDILGDVHKFPIILELSWLLFLISIGIGFLVIGAISRELNDAGDATKLNIYSGNVAWPAFLQLLSFGLALLLFIVFVFLNMGTKPGRPPAQSTSSTVTIKGPVAIEGSINANGPVTATGPITVATPTQGAKPSAEQHNRRPRRHHRRQR
jgi:hypothetical protein